jgi:hypothetical protein
VSRANVPLEIVHPDLMGPSPVAGFLSRERYVMTLLDDHSTYSEVVCLQRKDEAQDVSIEISDFGNAFWLRTLCLIFMHWGIMFSSFPVHEYGKYAEK